MSSPAAYQGAAVLQDMDEVSGVLVFAPLIECDGLQDGERQLVGIVHPLHGDASTIQQGGLHHPGFEVSLCDGHVRHGHHRDCFPAETSQLLELVFRCVTQKLDPDWYVFLCSGLPLP